MMTEQIVNGVVDAMMHSLVNRNEVYVMKVSGGIFYTDSKEILEDVLDKGAVILVKFENGIKVI